MTVCVAIECGGTHSRAGVYSEAGGCTATAESAGANPVECGPACTAAVVAAVVRDLAPDASEVFAAIAGARTADFAARIAHDVAIRLNAPMVFVTDDLTPLLHENLAGRPGILAIAGTGSCVMACSETGEIARAGGRGTLFGDPGSAYQVAICALRAAAEAIDGVGPDTLLVQKLMDAAGLHDFEDFRQWGRFAPKSKIASLAPFVSRLADEGDGVAMACLREQAGALAAQVFAAADRAHLDPPETVVFHGGLVQSATVFRDTFRACVSARWPSASVEPASIAGHEAVARYALRNPSRNGFAIGSLSDTGVQSQTEQRLPGPALDTLPTVELVHAMTREDARAAAASAQAEPDVAALITRAAARFEAGGRIIYIGAGTSGRLGVLDASECHPTFGVPAGRVVGIMAGGETALRNSVEGAEDDTDLAVADLAALRPALNSNDVVIGISASGTTPYVRAALNNAREAGAMTALVTCNLMPDSLADHVICLDTGPEILPGSTRLKAGTATKMVLNQISTGVLALSGFVYDGYMVGVTPTNAKLRARAQRILSDILDIQPEEAAALLDRAGNAVPVAILMHKRAMDRDAAVQQLKEAGGSLRHALESA